MTQAYTWRMEAIRLSQFLLVLLASHVTVTVWAVHDAQTRGKSQLWAFFRASGVLCPLVLLLWWPARRRLRWLGLRSDGA